MRSGLIRTLCLLAALVAGMGSWLAPAARADDAGAATAPAIDPYQIFFSIGMQELRKQNYSSAIKVLRALSEKVPSQRVKLELARAYFLDRQYARARTTFEAVLGDPTLPWGVRENVERYLDLIDEALGSVKFSLSVIADSNPLNFTDHRQINIAGQTLTLTPPAANRSVYGLQYGLDVTRALTGDASLVGFINASVKDFEGGELDRWIVDAGLALQPREFRRFQGRLGLQESFYGGEHQYRQPYASLTYFPDPIDQLRFSTALKLAYLDVDQFDYLDALTQSLDLRGSRVLANGIQLIGSLYLENAAAAERPYSYRGAGFGATVSLPLVRSLGMNTSASIGTRNYRASDPLFAERRRDLTRKLSVTWYDKRLRLFDLTPEIGVAYERTDSSIDFHEYDKVTLILRASE